MCAGTADVQPDWGPVARRIREQATDNWDDTVAVERFEGKGGRFLRATGRIVAPGRVRAGDQEITARRGIVVATGAGPAIPPIDGLADVPYWTNREAIAAEEVPSSLVVLGGGAIGLELAQVFARFGAGVAVVEALDQLLPLEEPEVGDLLAEVFGAEGIAVHTAAKAVRVGRDGSRIRVTLEDGTELPAERLLVATGRRVDLGAVGLGAVGVDESARAAPTDGHLRVARGRVGRRRRHRAWRLHPRRHVPVPDRGGRHPRRGPRRGRVPRRPPCHLHRSGGGLGRAP